MSQTGNPIKATLTEHPRITAFAFATLVLLSTMGVAAAGKTGLLGP